MTQAVGVEEAITIRRLSPVLGAEVIGIDLSSPMDESEVARLRAALHENGVLCFRDQHLTEEQQIEFSRRWGPLEEFPEEDKTVTASTVYNERDELPFGVFVECCFSRLNRVTMGALDRAGINSFFTFNTLFARGIPQSFRFSGKDRHVNRFA